MCGEYERCIEVPGGEPEGMCTIGRPRPKGEHNIKIYHQEYGWQYRLF